MNDAADLVTVLGLVFAFVCLSVVSKDQQYQINKLTQENLSLRMQLEELRHK